MITFLRNFLKMHLLSGTVLMQRLGLEAVLSIEPVLSAKQANPLNL